MGSNVEKQPIKEYSIIIIIHQTQPDQVNQTLPVHVHQTQPDHVCQTQPDHVHQTLPVHASPADVSVTHRLNVWQ